MTAYEKRTRHAIAEATGYEAGSKEVGDIFLTVKAQDDKERGETVVLVLTAEEAALVKDAINNWSDVYSDTSADNGHSNEEVAVNMATYKAIVARLP